MSKRTGPTNPELKGIIVALKKSKKYPELVKTLAKPRRKKQALNLFDLDKADEDKIAVAEVLGTGELTKKKTVYAWRFSGSAKEKITKSGGKALSLHDLLKEKETVKVIV